MRATVFMLLLASYSYAQTSAHLKAINNYADYANQSADEMAAVVMSVIQYYPTIHQKSSWGAPRYTCPVQLEDYYLKTAQSGSKALPANVASALNKRLDDIQKVAERVDEKCKALDTYHKLEDYKKDNFAQAVVIINELQHAVVDYRSKQDALVKEMETAFRTVNSGADQSAYGKADAALKKEIARERAFLDTWTFNLHEDVPTGWPVEKLEQSITETVSAIAMLRKMQPALKYPTSSMWSNFQESLSNVLEAKRHALDEYNHEAKKSDRHGNDSYLGLINYFNGTLVTDQNSFNLYASNDGYYGLKSVRYFPMFAIRNEAVVQSVEVKPFTDYPRTPLNPPVQRAALSRPAYSALVNYVDYINETHRQTRYLAQLLHNLRGDVKRYDKVDSYGRHGRLDFDYKEFQLPLSQYQKTIAESGQLSPPFAKALNQQAEVLLNILKELDAVSATLQNEADQEKYDEGRSVRVVKWLNRGEELLAIWDERKEGLYEDVRKVFDAYPAAQAASSWNVSGKALQQLTDLSHDGLFKAKAFYLAGQAGPKTAISTEAIDIAVRDVISKEFQNMKGIEKFGRNNGLCPYTPYEDLPMASKKLSEYLNPLATGAGQGYQHPYYKVLYQYNEVVRYYNTFCELSKTNFLLPAIYQPLLFGPDITKESVAAVSPAADRPPVVAPEQETAGTAPVKPANGSATKQEGGAVPAYGQSVNTTPPPLQTSSTTKLERDTVYIERRDTVFLTAPGENLHSMEGYAINHMVLLLDVSGSMNAPEKLPVLKASVLELVGMMRPEDKVSIVAFSDKPKVLLTATSFKDERRISEAINALKSSGKTDGNAAVKLAYKVADENYIRGGNNRIILATDGEFALSDPTREQIKNFSADDIFLSVFNFGKGAGASKSLAHVATLGRGNYQHITKDNVELQLIREVKAKRAR